MIGFYLLDQNQQGTTETVSQLPTSIQRNNQLGFIQQQPSIFLLFFFGIILYYLDVPLQQQSWQNNQLFQSTFVHIALFRNSS